MDVFLSAPGTVTAIPNLNAVPALIKVEGFTPVSALISGSDLEQRTAQQYQTALDRTVYVYVFGDHMGTVQIQGIAFMSSCEANANSGIVELMEFYNLNRLSRRAQPVTIALGNGQKLSGFLTQLKLRASQMAQDPAGLVNEFTMTINTLPGGQ